MVDVVLPTAFVLAHPGLSWPDLDWGYRRGLIGWQTPVRYAADVLGHSDPLAAELASIDKSGAHRVGELLTALSSRVPSDQERAAERWRYLLLEWALDRQSAIADPLAFAEDVYADFDYPDEMANFVRYMPPSDGYRPEEHSSKENIDRLMANWKKFLERERDRIFGG